MNKYEKLITALLCNGDGIAEEADGLGCANKKCEYRDADGACDLISMTLDAVAAITALQSENAELRKQRPVQVDGDVMALTLELAETKATLSRVEAERDAAIKDSVVRCCGTCNAHTQGTYNGKCMVCALCECVPENLREYHKKHYSKSLWEWRGA